MRSSCSRGEGEFNEYKYYKYYKYYKIKFNDQCDLEYTYVYPAVHRYVGFQQLVHFGNVIFDHRFVEKVLPFQVCNGEFEIANFHISFQF